MFRSVFSIRFRFSQLRVTVPKTAVFILLIMVSLVLVSETAVAQSASPGDVLIVEVNADPWTGVTSNFSEPRDEFIELYNNSASTINLLDWTLNDNGSTTMTFPSIDLKAGKILVIARQDINFTLYGCSGIDAPLSYLPPTWFDNNLANSNDNIVLRDNLSNIIDGVSYGTDVSVLNPAASDVFDNSGTSLQRRTYNTGFVDTDTSGDWIGSTGSGTPCDVSPTAVSLQSFTSNSNNTFIALIAMAFVLMGGTAVVWHRKQETSEEGGQSW